MLVNIGRDGLISEFAKAIAYQEGYYVPGSVAQRNNNPGNLKLDIGGNTAYAVGQDPRGFMIYATAADGWEDLQQQIRFWFDGQSRVISPDMSIREIAQRYTTTEQKYWARNVAARLGVSIDATLTTLDRIAGGIIEAGGQAYRGSVTAVEESPGLALGILAAVALLLYSQRR